VYQSGGSYQDDPVTNISISNSRNIYILGEGENSMTESGVQTHNTMNQMAAFEVDIPNFTGKHAQVPYFNNQLQYTNNNPLIQS